MRHLLQVGQQQVFTAPELVQRPRALEVVVEPARRHGARRLLPRRRQQLLRPRGQFSEQLVLVVQVDGHGA